MNTSSIPASTVGCIGMVAALHRVRGEDDGRLVAVRHPMGFVSELVGSLRPVFAWQVLVLGEPVKVNGRHCREIIVPDKCLRPVSQLADGQVERLVKIEAKKDFDAALNDLATLLNARDISPDEFEAFAESAVSQVQFEHAMEVVPICQVLQEVGFKQVNPPEGETYRWVGVNGGVELIIEGGPSWIGQWQLCATACGARTVMCDEVKLLVEWSRGRIVQSLVDLWFTAFRGAPVPDSFALGVLYRQHQEDMRKVEPGLPHVEVDGPIFRATRRWIAERHGLESDIVGPHPDIPLTLTVANGLLQFSVQGQTYGCPVRRGWIDRCSISLKQFLGFPQHVFRGHGVDLSLTMEELILRGVGRCTSASVHTSVVMG